MNYIESVKKFVLESKDIILDEIEFFKKEIDVYDEAVLKTKFVYPYAHNLGHLDIIERILDNADSGCSENDLKVFIQTEKLKAANYIKTCDEKEDDTLFDYQYFFSDGIACELDEEYFLKERQECSCEKPASNIDAGAYI